METASRAKKDVYVEREQVPFEFGVSCFMIHTYILGYTTAHKYIKPIIYQLADTENQGRKKKEGCKGQGWKKRAGLGDRNDIS